MPKLEAGAVGVDGDSAVEPVEVGSASGQGDVTTLSHPMVDSHARARVRSSSCVIFTGKAMKREAMFIKQTNI